jgi:hypothetical protein
MPEPKDEFVRMNIKQGAKREIDIIAASEQRPVYEIVEDMLKLYKAAAVGKSLSKKSKPVSVADVIATH